MTPFLTFGQALDLLLSGAMITRANWNGKGQFLKLQVPDEGSKMNLPYIYISTVQGHLVPWVASQTDILADDWEQFSDLSEQGNDIPAEDQSEEEIE